MGDQTSYYYLYSDISSQYVSAVEASLNQLDPALNGLSVAQCANYGISLMDDYEEAGIDYAEEGDENDIPWAGIVIVGTIASCAFGLPICILPF